MVCVCVYVCVSQIAAPDYDDYDGFTVYPPITQPTHTHQLSVHAQEGPSGEATGGVGPAGPVVEDPAWQVLAQYAARVAKPKQIS